MPGVLTSYVRIVEAVNRRVGRIAMYLLFILMGILLWSSAAKLLFETWPFLTETLFPESMQEQLASWRLAVAPPHWTLLMAQFTMVAYYMLGGAYSLQMGSNVRMDLFYGEWTDRQKAWADAMTVFALLFYLGVLLYGGFSSTAYSIEYGERAPGAWRPYMWPIKVIMCVAVALMLLQAVALLIRDIAVIRGTPLEPSLGASEGER